MFVSHYIPPKINIVYKEKKQTEFMFWWLGGFRREMVKPSYMTSEAMVLIQWQQCHHTGDVLASTVPVSRNDRWQPAA